MNTTPAEFPALYHAHHLLRSEDLDFWRRLAAGCSGPVLELGCGTGRVSTVLMRDGHELTALDNDPVMLRYFRRHGAAEALSGLEIVQADMTDFHLQRRYGLIILPCNTFSTFASPARLRILAAVHRHLIPGGRFVFSIPNPVRMASLPVIGDLELEEEFAHPDSGAPVQVFSSWERTADSLVLFWRYDIFAANQELLHVRVSTRHHLDPAEQYLWEAREQRFVNLQTCGDFDEKPYGEDSDYLLVFAERAV